MSGLDKLTLNPTSFKQVPDVKFKEYGMYVRTDLRTGVSSISNMTTEAANQRANLGRTQLYWCLIWLRSPNLSWELIRWLISPSSIGNYGSGWAVNLTLPHLRGLVSKCNTTQRSQWSERRVPNRNANALMGWHSLRISEVSDVSKMDQNTTKVYKYRNHRTSILKYIYGGKDVWPQVRTMKVLTTIVRSKPNLV